MLSKGMFRCMHVPDFSVMWQPRQCFVATTSDFIHMALRLVRVEFTPTVCSQILTRVLCLAPSQNASVSRFCRFPVCTIIWPVTFIWFTSARAYHYFWRICFLLRTGVECMFSPSGWFSYHQFFLPCDEVRLTANHHYFRGNLWYFRGNRGGLPLAHSATVVRWLGVVSISPLGWR